MNLKQIEVFRAVMLAGSITEAAKLLNVSQPGVSRSVAHIELQLGIPLFERRKGKLLATPEAHALYVEVQRVYGGVNRIQDCAEALKRGEHMTLRVAASPSTMLELIPLAATELVRQYPGAKIHIDSLTVPDMIKHLTSHELDIAISTIRLNHPLLDPKSLGKWVLVGAFPKGHAFEKLKTVHLKDLVVEPMISFATETIQGKLVADWCERHHVTLNAPIQVRSGLNACAMVAHGAGLAIVDELTARAYQGDRLSFRPLADAPATDVTAVSHAHSSQSILSKAFVEQVQYFLRKLGS